MKLENEFTVNASVEDAWKAMKDLERVTPCLPGAQLTEQVGDEYKGEMSVKTGPVTAKYNGTVRIEEADDSEHRDRKSTRLNSSHANISYAVFCLKKKILLTTLPRTLYV